MKPIYNMAILLIALILVACEEDVVLDLGDIEKKLVVEAVVSNNGSLAKVSLSYSQGFYDSLAFNIITNASVEIETESGENEMLALFPDGNYYSQILEPEFGMKYTLNIENEGKLITAETILPEPVDIKRVQFIPSPFERNGDSLHIIVYADDPIGEDNYFRLKVRRKGEPQSNIYYFITDETSIDGEIQMPVYFDNYYYGDTVIVELMHTTREVSEYYSGLSDNVGGSFNSIAPGNPVNNLPDDVFGIFAAYAFDIDTIIVTAFPAF